MTSAELTTAPTLRIPGPATPYQGDIARYWDGEARPVNLRLGDVDGLYHHHYGIGEVDTASLGNPEDSESEKKLITELHRLESAQAEFLLGHLGDIGRDDTLVDAGCGRGGSMAPKWSRRTSACADSRRCISSMTRSSRVSSGPSRTDGSQSPMP